MAVSAWFLYGDMFSVDDRALERGEAMEEDASERGVRECLEGSVKSCLLTGL